MEEPGAALEGSVDIDKSRLDAVRDRILGVTGDECPFVVSTVLVGCLNNLLRGKDPRVAAYHYELTLKYLKHLDIVLTLS